LISGILRIAIGCSMIQKMNDENITEYEYNQMIIEILEKNIVLLNLNLIMSLFVIVEVILLMLDYISFVFMVYGPLMFALFKIWNNRQELIANGITIQYIQDLRDKNKEDKDLPL